MKVLVRLRASSMGSRHRGEGAGSRGSTREALRWNEPNLREGLASGRIPGESEPNLQNEANFTLNVNKMESLMRILGRTRARGVGGKLPANFTLTFETARFPGMDTQVVDEMEKRNRNRR